MNKLYRFSPIKIQDALLEAVQYVALKTTELGKSIVGVEYTIGYLTIFTHYPDEFNELREIAAALGEIKDANNGFMISLEAPIQLPNNELTKLRIRKPDPYRAHVGCNDFVIPQYEAFKNEFLGAKPSNLRLIERPDYEMIEFFDPDFDVLAYVVNKEFEL